MASAVLVAPKTPELQQSRYCSACDPGQRAFAGNVSLKGGAAPPCAMATCFPDHEENHYRSKIPNVLT